MEPWTSRRYTVAWICPIGVEYRAAVRMLGKQHKKIYMDGDPNSYAVGSIYGHNVVILVLPDQGNEAAATDISDLKRSFRDLELALLVGIGVGVPVQTDSGDIRLGDVVVGTPASVHPGTAAISPPPRALLGAVRELEAIRNRDNDPIGTNLRRFDTPDLKLQYSHPGTNEDRLFRADYHHRAVGATCVDCGCDMTMLVGRQQRIEGDQSPYVVVHHGSIGTGSLVIKDATTRDTLAHQFGIICFETEAAGMLYNLSCLVIRGIADYCDFHKNNNWHNYAAACAAAYARALLKHVAHQPVKRSVDDRLAAEEQRESTAIWLSPVNYEHQQRHFYAMQMEGTGQWIFEAQEFKKWVECRKEILFFSGPPGVGKTVITSSVIQYLQRRFSSEPLVGIAYVYCDPTREDEQIPLKLLSNILKQLCTGLDSIPESIANLRRRQVFVVVDTLDETLGYHSNWEQFLSTLADLQTNTDVNILITSRKIPRNNLPFRGNIAKIEIHAPASDVEVYLDYHIAQLPFGCNNTSMNEQVKACILRALEKTPR
ncbi:nucleoside phosphorylase domain-containing protein [Aspergillus spinulosporus]